MFLRFNSLFKILVSLLLVNILFISCENSAIYLVEDTLENTSNSEPNPTQHAVEKSCTFPSNGAISEQGVFGTCTVNAFGPVSKYKPTDTSFNGVDVCTINAYAIQYDYTTPSTPTCQVYDCRLVRGPPCI